MKVKVSVGELSDLCGQVSQSLDRLTHTALGHMYLRARKDGDKGWLYAFSTNLTTQALVKVPVEVEEPGEVLVQPDKINDFLISRDKEAEVTMTKGDTYLRLQCRRSRVDLPTMPKEAELANLVKTMPFQDKESFKLKGADLAEFVRRGMFCIPPDDHGQAGQVIGGMYFTSGPEGYEAYATDGCIATQIRVQADKGNDLKPFMLPLKTLHPLQRLIGKRREEEISMVPGPIGQYGMVSIFFRFGDAMFGSSLLHGQFPQLKSVVEGQTAEAFFTVNREELKAAVARCSAFATKTRTMHLELKKETLELKVRGEQEFIDSVAIEHEKEYDGQIKLAIAIDYLANIVSGSHAETLRVGVSGPLKPLVISDTSDPRVQSKYVVASVRI